MEMLNEMNKIDENDEWNGHDWQKSWMKWTGLTKMMNEMDRIDENDEWNEQNWRKWRMKWTGLKEMINEMEYGLRYEQSRKTLLDIPAVFTVWVHTVRRIKQNISESVESRI